MYNRPDRPLIVKCSLDTWNKKITFSSARNCTYDVLRRKVEQCYSLSSTAFAISYKDDDGEITNIAADSDLTEAIQYFQAGDDAPLSSTASILSGRSFGSRKVTLRVHITVDYDGPSLSDTSSLVSLDEYKSRNASQQSFSFGSPSVDLDDDSVTVSSRDNGGPSSTPSRLSGAVGRSSAQPLNSPDDSDKSLFTLAPRPPTILEGSRDGEGEHSSRSESDSVQPHNPFSDDYELSVNERYPADPSAVFERLKLRDDSEDDQGFISLERDDRGAAWLKDQNERAIRSRLGTLPDSAKQLGGALALERDPRGRYYYTYTSVGSSASQTHDLGYDDSINGHAGPAIDDHRPRPTSMHLHWLASQQIQPKNTRPLQTSLSVPSFHTHHSDPLPKQEHCVFNTGSAAHFGVDKELLQFLPLPMPPLESLTDCSKCGMLLDAIRYVCSTCGEKLPVRDYCSNKGKEKAPQNHSYPPFSSRSSSSSPATTSSSQTYVERSELLYSLQKPLPSVPPSPDLTIPGAASIKGYELCSGCIESAGVDHAIEAGLASGLSPGISPPVSPEDAQAASQWRRAAPKKGQLRHAYHEKIWGHNGWEDVEQDEIQISKCSTCGAITPRKRYKCTSCPNINLCRACYSQVHELHPSHAFLAVPDKRIRSNSEPDFFSSPPPDSNDEQSLKHPGVKCAHCLLDIVGARFHCAICDSVDICANCESAGLPGNLDSADGGHISSHILIKIPYPLETTELEIASQRAIHLWTGRDAASVGLSAPRSKPSSVISSYARTIVGPGSRHPSTPPDDHRLFCNSCSHPIIGIRYQCANCPSSPRAFNLCQNCEKRSYNLHDPMHVFFKLPRPVQRPLESPFPMVPVLYKAPAGPPTSVVLNDPRAYLRLLVHTFAVCDRCMTCIEGEWFRCAYCARDLCDACQEVDTHDDSHVFLVFKSTVDMQAFKTFANLDNPHGGPPVIPYPVYR